MSDDGAKVGDRAIVMFGDGESIDGIVKHVPCAVGDSWILHTKNRTILHIQQFESLVVMDREAPKEQP